MASTAHAVEEPTTIAHTTMAAQASSAPGRTGTTTPMIPAAITARRPCSPDVPHSANQGRSNPIQLIEKRLCSAKKPCKSGTHNSVRRRFEAYAARAVERGSLSGRSARGSSPLRLHRRIRREAGAHRPAHEAWIMLGCEVREHCERGARQVLKGCFGSPIGISALGGLVDGSMLRRADGPGSRIACDVNASIALGMVRELLHEPDEPVAAV